MRKFAETCEAIAATTRKLEKTGIVAEYLKARALEEASVSAVFLSGKPFPAWEETTLQVGGKLLWQLVSELSGKSEAEVADTYRRLGDLGAVAGEVLDQHRSDNKDQQASFPRSGQTGASAPTWFVASPPLVLFGA